MDWGFKSRGFSNLLIGVYRCHLMANKTLPGILVLYSSLALLFWLATPDRFYLEINVMVPRPDGPSKQCDIN